MEDSGATPESSKAGTKSAAAAARKVKAKQTRALDILKRDTGIVESNRPSRVGIIQDVSGTSSLTHLRTSSFGSLTKNLCGNKFHNHNNSGKVNCETFPGQGDFCLQRRIDDQHNQLRPSSNFFQGAYFFST